MKTIQPHTPESHSEETSLLAYYLWEQAHCPPGQELHFWLEAERQLSGTRDPQPAVKTKAAASRASATAGHGQIEKGGSAIKSPERETRQIHAPKTPDVPLPLPRRPGFAGSGNKSADQTRVGMKVSHTAVNIPAGYVHLEGDLDLPDDAAGIVLFVHGSGSSRHSPRNQQVAHFLREAGLGTLLFDLLTCAEEQQDAVTGALRFDIDVLAERLLEVTRWLQQQPAASGLKVGYFVASTGGAAALMAAAVLGDSVSAVVMRGGRPDLAGNALHDVRSPTLLIVGGYDEKVICLNQEAHEKLRCEKDLRIVPGATHLFEEPGMLEQVAQLSAHWFVKHMHISAK